MAEQPPSVAPHPVACWCAGTESDATCRTRWVNGVGATNCYATFPHKGHAWELDGRKYRCRGIKVRTPAQAVEALRYRFDDWRDEWTDRRKLANNQDARTLGVPVKARWWLARQMDRLPGQCWADLAEYGLGWTLLPWAPTRGLCEKSARENGCGSCYCGKIATASAATEGKQHGYTPHVVIPDPAPSGKAGEE